MDGDAWMSGGWESGAYCVMVFRGTSQGVEWKFIVLMSPFPACCGPQEPGTQLHRTFLAPESGPADTFEQPLVLTQ